MRIALIALGLAGCGPQQAEVPTLEEAYFEITEEFDVCFKSPVSIEPLPSLEQAFDSLLQENRRLAASSLLHQELAEWVSREQHLSLLEKVNASQREFVEYREQNPVHGGFAGSASTGFTGAEFNGTGFHLFMGLLEILPAYQAAGLDDEVNALYEELIGLIEDYEKQRNCGQNAKLRFPGCRGDWVRTDYDMVEVVSPRKAREMLHETLYRSGAWDLLDDKQVAPTTRRIRNDPRDPTRCAHLYRGDRPNSEFERLKGCQSVSMGALRANRNEVTERYARRDWTKAMEVAESKERSDYRSAITQAGLVFRSTNDAEPLRKTIHQAFRHKGDKWEFGDAQNNYRAVSLAASCSRIASKRVCQELGGEVFKENVACVQRTNDGAMLHQNGCDDAVRDLHPAIFIQQDYELGAVLSAVEKEPTDQIELLDSLSRSKGFVSALSLVCSLGIQDANKAQEFDAMVRVMAHQVMSIKALRDEDEETAEFHLQAAYASLDALNDRRSVIPIVWFEYGNSSKDYNAAVLFMLLARHKNSDEASAQQR